MKATSDAWLFPSVINTLHYRCAVRIAQIWLESTFAKQMAKGVIVVLVEHEGRGSAVRHSPEPGQSLLVNRRRLLDRWRGLALALADRAAGTQTDSGKYCYCQN